MVTPEEEIIKCISTRDNNALSLLLQNHPGLADGKTENGVSYLLMAAYYRNAEAVDLLRQKKSAINLYEASAIGILSVVKQVVDSNPTLINSFSADGFTPIGLACFFGHVDIAKHLIDKGADVNIASNNSFKVAPIHSACAISNYELVELLLQNKANVNLRQGGDVTPLHAAVHNGQTRLARLLIESGADVNAQTVKGETPWQMANEKLFTETAALIKQHDGK